MQKLHHKTLKRILNYARGSFYRLNAQTAEFYSFTLLPKENNKIEWQGGYCWREDNKDGEIFMLNLSTGKLV